MDPCRPPILPDGGCGGSLREGGCGCVWPVVGRETRQAGCMALGTESVCEYGELAGWLAGEEMYIRRYGVLTS